MIDAFQKLLPLALIVTFGFSCGETQTEGEGFSETELQTQQQSWDAIMAVHDAIMPQVSDINRTARDLKDRLENDTTLDAEEKENIQAAVEKLEGAEEAMFAWMNDLRRPQDLRKAQSHTEIMAYYDTLDREIQQIKVDMETSLQEGQALLPAAD